MLLYLVKHTRPDIANTVQQLSKALDKLNEAAFKEMKQVIKYVINTKYLALKIKPKLNEDGSWNIVAYSDTDFAGDVESRITITGFILYFSGAPISWKSKGMKSIAQSSSEVEYIALLEAAKVVEFVYHIPYLTREGPHQLVSSFKIQISQTFGAALGSCVLVGTLLVSSM